ncbi:MAG: IS110 family transposase, partial [Bacteroidota bacterium]|nr:IS110 family transposase [Bacteroidota bacterium]
MTKVKANFSEHRIDVGLDVHKRSWNAAIFLNGMYVRNVHQPPSPKALQHYLLTHYPCAHYRCAYESGKFGYWIHRELTTLGIDCLVINPADIPSTHKDEVYKNDSRDARGIAQALAAGQLKSIYIPSVEQEADRNLLRHRKKLWRDLVRCKNRVKGFLDYCGIPLPPQFDNANWSHNFINWLQQLSFGQSTNRMTLDYQIREVQMLRRELLNISNDIRKLMRSKKYKDLYYLLRSLSGIGPLTAAALITEIGNMKRFPSFYHLNSFVGLMPMEHSSGERELKGRITIRKHRQLRSELIECAWAAKRNDPALALYY